MVNQILYDKEKQAILRAVLPEAEKYGFSIEVIQTAISDALLLPEILHLCFPRGVIDLVVYFVQQGTQQMTQELESIDLSDMKIRQRIHTSVKKRLEIDLPYKKLSKRAFSILALPMHAIDALKLLYQTSDEIWKSIKDTSLDGNFYSKRIILAGLYTSVRLVWLEDNSEGQQDSWIFLDKQIEHVMQFEQKKYKLKTWSENLPNPIAILAKYTDI